MDTSRTLPESRMDDREKCRYDFFGEGLSKQQTPNEDKPLNNTVRNRSSLKIASKMNSVVVEESLMEFITEYFNGEVTDEFSSSEYFPPTAEKPSGLFANSFGTSSSDGNVSFDSLTPQNISKDSLNVSNESSTSDSSDNSRKSISYEIRFINSTERDGKIKLKIVPSRQLPSSPDYTAQSSGNMINHENLCLRQRVQDLERRLQCVEGESVRIIGELKRIIERKNEIISHLELQTAGIRFMNNDN
ncbi:unnamed protein product [Orchesella dallaii]|uniref:Uncharacterized protein n=1 Tax=Orchesella dallaii TaxID=48710 RepID=A0ABP1S2R8_9HEXA